MILTGLLATLSEVEFSWRQTIGDDANPLDIALPLLDNTSVGLAHRRGEFLDLKDRISNGLRQTVNEHFQAFNDSVGSYRSVVQSIANSQHTLNKIKDTVNSTSKDISETGESMGSLNENVKNYNEMIAILNNIEYIKKAPNDLDDAFSDKNYSKAQLILQNVQQKAQTFKLWSLPALSNLENYFQIQSQQLFEILIEEIHNIIYSKKLFNTFNSGKDEYRNPESSDYTSIEKYIMSSIDTDILETSAASHYNVDKFIRSLMTSNTRSTETDLKSGVESTLEDDDNTSSLITFDDSNPFNQLYHLLTIVYKLDKLPTAIDIIIQRNANEINQLINRQTEDTKLRHSKIIKYLNTNTKADELSKGIGIDQSLNNDNFKTVVIKDLFWNFFRKLLFLLQSVRVILKIIEELENSGLQVNSSRSKLSTSNDTLTLHRLWSSLKSEIKNLVLSYISNNDLSLSSKLTATSSLNGNTINGTSTTSQKDNTLFQFYKVDYDKDHTNQFKLVLQDLFPGFINSNDMAKIDSPYIEDSKFLKQTRLIPANIFHMRIILEPFLTFIQGSKLLLSQIGNNQLQQQDNDETIQFFNQFMNVEFLPLLEESFIQFYIEEVEEIDPYEVLDTIDEKSTLLSTQNLNKYQNGEIFKFFIEFKKFFNDVCFILNTSLQFRKEFSSIIFNLLNKFQDKVEEFSNELLNELNNYFEPNREIIRSLQDPSAKISQQALSHINKSELRRLKIYENFQILDKSIEFISDWLENYLVKKIDLNKTDLNLSTIEKLRKNWSFFETSNNFKTHINHNDELDLKNSTVRIILNDELIENFQEIVHQYKIIDKKVKNVLNRYNELLKV
ncbi:putative exocyst complex component sec8 [Wickerhamomyces ciferrii]|uniref:Exocyst complex component Sec8 n=1 Tax=Wickerhamomyces ciferrii (strain ATCC 14091 / BCRC 22168 / CBS 111 / JCM 3599 / NBRC 0793 / NRRL Y-1031 F-60-10) TaxID=1206466 RepID=K0KVD5_WICCF|nr:putative exocyst complex component sec8 [Wickerhamomyces ciferrii]CCH45404.1 putative exocyst complex component sec8 [Wickerhamomyces ciferrii]